MGILTAFAYSGQPQIAPTNAAKALFVVNRQDIPGVSDLTEFGMYTSSAQETFLNDGPAALEALALARVGGFPSGTVAGTYLDIEGQLTWPFDYDTAHNYQGALAFMTDFNLVMESLYAQFGTSRLFVYHPPAYDPVTEAWWCAPFLNDYEATFGAYVRDSSYAVNPGPWPSVKNWVTDPNYGLASLANRVALCRSVVYSITCGYTTIAPPEMSGDSMAAYANFMVRYPEIIFWRSLRNVTEAAAAKYFLSVLTDAELKNQGYSVGGSI